MRNTGHHQVQAKPPADQLTFDQAGNRHLDENGFLHVAVSHISKETVNPYYGREIPGWQDLGLDPDRIYQGYRAGKALAEGAETFNGLPLLMNHHPDSAEDPQKDYRVGSLGTDAAFKAPYLDNSLILTDARAIEAVTAGLARELSACYRYDPDFTPGEFEGQAYDFIMTNIRGNHVALVEEGRAGPDVLVADQGLALDPTMPERPKQSGPSPIEKKGTIMNLLDKLKEFFASLISEGAKAEEIKAVLAEALPAPVETPAAGDEDPAKAETAPEPEKAADEDDPEAAGKADPADEEKEPAAADPAKDEEPEAKAEEPKAAQDAKLRRQLAQDMATVRTQAKAEAVAEITALMRAKSQAAEMVRPLVGSLDIMAFDTAGDIYRHALKARGISVTTKDRAALRDMVGLELKHHRAEGQAPAAFDAAPFKMEGPFAHVGNIRISQ